VQTVEGSGEIPARRVTRPRPLTFRVGDLDPCPGEHSAHLFAGPCGDYAAIPGGQWFCTRPAGHVLLKLPAPLEHLAGDGRTVLAVWGGE
jgi:hypothetical protein